MTVAQSGKETEAEGLRCAQPEGEASNMRASEDILAKAKAIMDELEPFAPLYLIPDLVKEIERLRSLNPFFVDVSVGMRIRDNHFVYGNGEETAVLQNLLLAKNARIKELEAQIKHDEEVLDSWKADRDNWIVRCKRLEADFMKSHTIPIIKDGEYMRLHEKEAREELERIIGGKDEDKSR